MVRIDDGQLGGAFKALKRVHHGRDSIQDSSCYLEVGCGLWGAMLETRECVRLSHSSRHNGTVRRSPASPASPLVSPNLRNGSRDVAQNHGQ